MNTSIITIGNSKGIRIPKFVLEESGLGKDVLLKVKKGEIKIVAAIKAKKINVNSLLSEKALASDWNRPEEDKAWKNLQ